jgi:DNA modification methylase
MKSTRPVDQGSGTVSSAGESGAVASVTAPDYSEFLSGKVLRAPAFGFDAPDTLNKNLFPFQRAVVLWALRKGRCALFLDTGLGKSLCQLEWARQVQLHTKRKVLILTPLAVAGQTCREAAKFGIDARQIREADDDCDATWVRVANHEILHKLNPDDYVGIVIDESSLLKNFSGKVRKQLTAAFKNTAYRLCCTATPSPNDAMELGTHCEFLGIMDSHKMLARWFTNQAGEAGVWTLKQHGQKDFWRWCSTWSVSASRPSDIGAFDDAGYVLPGLDIVQQTVSVDITTDRADGELFRQPTLSATTLHKELRRTAPARAARVAELVAASPGSWIVWANTNYEADAITALIPDAVEIRGNDKLELKESRIDDFLAGKTRVLVSKPVILGSGLNLQCCHNMAFIGLSYSFEQFYQALRRSYRFGQTERVTAHVIAAATEGKIAEVVAQKKQAHERMQQQMVQAMRENGLLDENGDGTAFEYAKDRRLGRNWEMRLGDCVELVREVRDESVDFTVYSPPFSNLYTYSDSYRDMGNSADDAEFFKHYEFLLGELLRVTKGGRLMAVHVKQVVDYKGRDGRSGLRDFRGEVIRACERAGWKYHSEVCIWKCPVTEMQRTKSHGLLYKQLRKDSSYSRQGLAEYLCVFRKWGEVDASPVTKTEETFGLDMWQNYASPVWMDIDQTNVLNKVAAREDADTKHVCPLQLDVIERAVQLWSNPGDLVLSPFAGIGSEGHSSLQMDRRFLGFELKKSYFDTACANLERAVSRQGELFQPAVQ